MRRVILVLLALGLLGVGTALAGRGDPQKRIVPADQLRAKAMLVRAADLPGYQAQPGGADSDFYCKALDESDLTLTGEAKGQQFSQAVALVGSGARVYESRRDADVSWRRGTGAAGVRCAATLVRSEYAKQGVTFVSLQRMAFPRLAERTAALRARLTVTGPQGDVPLILDLLALKQSRAQATIVVGSALVPPDRSQEVRLARLVARRKKAAMRAG